jgi:molybdenum cofactor cytidylyltransferase
MNIGAVILAGGESKRMGKIKALLPINETPMLRQVVEKTLDTTLHPVVVVLGAHHKQVLPVLEKMPIGVIENPSWEQGLGSSIRMGLVGSYMITKGIDGLIFMAVDMPTVAEEHLSALIAAAESHTDAQVIWSKGTQFPFLVKAGAFENILDLNDESALSCLEKLPSFTLDAAPHPDLNTERDYLDHLNSY